MNAHITESYGNVSGVNKEEVFRSLATGVPIEVTVGKDGKKVLATVVALASVPNEDGIFSVVFQGPFVSGKTRWVKVEEYDTNDSKGGDGRCRFHKRFDAAAR